MLQSGGRQESVIREAMCLYAVVIHFYHTCLVNKYKPKNINFINIMSLPVTTVASLCSLSVSITLLFVSGELESFIQARRTPTCYTRAMKDFIEGFYVLVYIDAHHFCLLCILKNARLRFGRERDSSKQDEKHTNE